MRDFYLLPALLLCVSTSVFAQSNMGVGTRFPDASAVLDLTASDKGLLIPRMTTAQRVQTDLFQQGSL